MRLLAQTRLTVQTRLPVQIRLPSRMDLLTRARGQRPEIRLRHRLVFDAANRVVVVTSGRPPALFQPTQVAGLPCLVFAFGISHRDCDPATAVHSV